MGCRWLGYPNHPHKNDNHGILYVDRIRIEQVYRVLRLMPLLIVGILLLAACDNNPPSSIAYDELPADGDASRGEMLFNQTASPPCMACHQENATASPALAGFGAVAETRVDGQSAREYAFYSIVEPARHIVEGYGNAMPATYDDMLSPQDIADLIAYVLSL